MNLKSDTATQLACTCKCFPQLGSYKADDWLFGEGAGQPLSLDFQISCMDLHCLTAITLSNNVFAAIASELNSVLLILKALADG